LEKLDRDRTDKLSIFRVRMRSYREGRAFRRGRKPTFINLCKAYQLGGGVVVATVLGGVDADRCGILESLSEEKEIVIDKRPHYCQNVGMANMISIFDIGRVAFKNINVSIRPREAHYIPLT
jgi:hypothetical protein